tara:strand:- start:428 stop:1105 length:678 start_codon:yes stop_codon:yes gene_type:complete
MELPIGEPSDKPKVPKNDVDLKEFIEMGKKYLVIPISLIFVEIFYKLLTASQDTLAWIQIFEAKLWNKLNHIIFGNDSSILVEHKSGLKTQVELYNPNFPEITNNIIPLYVSDECAGVHEILFISVLISLTPNVSRKIKVWSIMIMAGIIFCLNMLRLVVLYPIALSSCNKNPGKVNCESAMYDFHQFVFEWGFLITLVVMWISWFCIVNSKFFKNIFEINNSDE